MDVETYLRRIEASFDSPPELQAITDEAEQDTDLDERDLATIEGRVSQYAGEADLADGDLVDVLPILPAEEPPAGA